MNTIQPADIAAALNVPSLLSLPYLDALGIIPAARWPALLAP